MAAYSAILADDIAGRLYSKGEDNHLLQSVINRPRRSIEDEHQNISAVLRGLGEVRVSGYKPAFKFQDSLADAVAHWLDRHADCLAPAAQMAMGPPPSVFGRKRCFGSAHHRCTAMRRRPTNSSPWLPLPGSIFGRARCLQSHLGRTREKRVLAHARSSLAMACTGT